MDIHFLDNESLMVLITCKSPFQSEKLNELIADIHALKEQGAMGFIFNFLPTPYIGSGAISLLGVLGAEAVMGNDLLRIICPNEKFRLHFELSGLLSVAKFMNSVDEAVQDLKNVLFIEDDLPQPIAYKETEVDVTLPSAANDNEDEFTFVEPKEAAPPPPPVSEAKPDEELPPTFQVKDLLPGEVPHAYLVPPEKDSEKGLPAELKHISNRMKASYEVLSEKVKRVLTSSSEDYRAQRAYPTREWVRSFAITQGTAPKVRHYFIGIGAHVHKKAKTLSYSSAQALDQYDFECYFTFCVLEPCELFGDSMGSREAGGWTYTQYSSRNLNAQSLVLKMLDAIVQHIG